MRITASFLRHCLNRSSLIGSFGVVLLFSCAVSPPALHEPAVATGTVDGTNTHPTGAAVVGAAVSLTDPSTGSSREVVTRRCWQIYLGERSTRKLLAHSRQGRFSLDQAREPDRCTTV
jgi:hypothetical protein